MEKRTRKQKGFSLIELLIVVAIILIIAAIAIPNLLRAHISANEASAAESIRTITTAQMTFNSTYPVTGFSSTVAALGPPAASGCPATGPTVAAACLIDWNLSQATAAVTAKSGYYFGMGTPGGLPVMNFTVGGSPGGFNTSGVRGFCSSEDAVIHFNPAQNGAPTTVSATCDGYAILQ